MDITVTRYLSVLDGAVITQSKSQAGLQPLLGNAQLLLPPLVGGLHRSFWAWGQAGLSPGQVIAARVWFGSNGELAFAFPEGEWPLPLLAVGLAPELAAWLVLLDKWVETFVVVARARAVWSVAELAAAMTFTTPAFLPRALVHQPPDNWARVAAALAVAIADGPLAGASQDRHWG
jgi:hypothetical protein